MLGARSLQHVDHGADITRIAQRRLSGGLLQRRTAGNRLQRIPRVVAAHADHLVRFVVGHVAVVAEKAAHLISQAGRTVGAGRARARATVGADVAAGRRCRCVQP